MALTKTVTLSLVRIWRLSSNEWIFLFLANLKIISLILFCIWTNWKTCFLRFFIYFDTIKSDIDKNCHTVFGDDLKIEQQWVNRSWFSLSVIVSCPTRWSLYWPLVLCIDHLSLLSTERHGVQQCTRSVSEWVSGSFRCDAIASPSLFHF